MVVSMTVAQLDEMVQRAVKKVLAETPSLPITSASKKVKKQKKEKDPDAPKKAPSDWINFTGSVRNALKEAGHKVSKEVQQFSSFLKEKNADYSSWTAESMVEEFKSWTPPEVSKQAAEGKNKGSRKNSDASQTVADASAATAVAEKAKKVLSPEHLAKMKAGREAAKAKKDGEATLMAIIPPKPEGPKPEPKKAVKVVAPAPSVAPAEEEWRRTKDKKYLYNPKNNHCYNAEKDGSQGAWAGIRDPATGKIDDSVEEPQDFEEEQ